MLVSAVALAHEHTDQLPTVYGFFKEDCFDLFFQPKGLRVFLGDKECLKFSISKAIEYAVVLSAIIVRIPQIMKLAINFRAKGLSPLAYYVETIAFMQTAAYSRHLGLPFSMYGENLFIFAQNMAIICIIWHVDREISDVQKFAFGTFVFIYTGAAFSGLIPEYGWAYVSSTTLALNMLSRIPLILANFINKSTGDLSFATFVLMFLASNARAATVFYESDDLMLRAQTTLALCLNTILVI